MAFTFNDAAKATTRFEKYVAERENSSINVLQSQINEINATVKNMNSNHDGTINFDNRIKFWNNFHYLRDKLQSTLDAKKLLPETKKAEADLENTSKITNTIIYVIIGIAILVTIFLILKFKKS